MNVFEALGWRITEGNVKAISVGGTVIWKATDLWDMLFPPSVKLDENTLVITPVDNKAEEFAIYANGEEVAVIVNEAETPELPEVEMVEITGTWRLNEAPSPIPAITQELSFSCNDIDCKEIFVDEYSVQFKAERQGPSGTPYFTAYNKANGWTDEAYRTILFYSAQLVTKTFYDWLDANAVEVPLPSPTVELKDERLYMTAGGKITEELAIFVNGEEMAVVDNDQAPTPTISWDRGELDISIGPGEVPSVATLFIDGVKSKDVSCDWSVDYTRINLNAVGLEINGGAHILQVKLSGNGLTESEISNELVIYGVSGTWRFNDKPNPAPEKIFQLCNFTTQGGSIFGGIEVGTGPTNYSIEFGVGHGDKGDGYSADSGWVDGHQVITFDGVQYVSKEFYEWLEANATQQTIGFTIGGTEYFADVGMTWEQWCESNYNTGGWYISGTTNMVKQDSGLVYIKYVSATDIIVTQNYAVHKPIYDPK